MTVPSDRIPARAFTPDRWSGLVWRTLDAVAPSIARRYLDTMIRARVSRMREKPMAGGAPVSILGGFELNIGVARAAQILRTGLEATGGQFGLQVMCVGLGMATATIIERL